MRTLNSAVLAIALTFGVAGHAFAPSAAQAGARDDDRITDGRLRRDAIERLARPRNDLGRSVDRRMMPGQMNSLGQQVPSLTLPAPDNPAGAGHRRE